MGRKTQRSSGRQTPEEGASGCLRAPPGARDERTRGAPYSSSSSSAASSSSSRSSSPTLLNSSGSTATTSKSVPHSGQETTSPSSTSSSSMSRSLSHSGQITMSTTSGWAGCQLTITATTALLYLESLASSVK